MTQAVNLANFANNLDSSGGVSPSALNAVVPISKGGTNASTAAGAKSNIGAASSGANSDITSLSGLTTALSVDQGGTGTTSITSGGIVKGNGTSSLSVATSADIVAAIGSTAVANSTNSVTSTNSTNALGYSQSWQNVLSSRAAGTTYTNTTGKPIAISITHLSTNGSSSIGSTLTVNGVVAASTTQVLQAYSGGTIFSIIPASATYVFAFSGGSGSIVSWAELR